MTKEIHLILLLLFSAFLLLSNPLAAAEYSAELIDFGTMEIGRKRSEAIVNDDMKQVFYEELRIKQKTDVVQAKIGTRFGIQFKILGPFENNEIDIVKRWFFPPQGLTNPDSGKTYYSVENILAVTAEEVKTTSITFTEEYDLVAGNWTIQLLHKGDVLLTKQFTVYK